MTRTILALTICAPLALLALEPRTAVEHNSFPMQPGARLTLTNINGSIEINGWDQSMIDITATKSAETDELLNQIKVDISAAADGLHIRTVQPENFRGGVKYVIKAPKGIQLAEIQSTNGSIRVGQIDGPAKLHTTNGSVHATEMGGESDVQTTNGSVHISLPRGPLTAITTNGGIHADLADTRGGAVNLATTNGGVDLKLGALAQSPVKASTTNGGITVHMPRTTGVRVVAETSANSRIRTDFDIRREGQNSDSRLEGVIGSGGSTMELKTSQGSIRLTE